MEEELPVKPTYTDVIQLPWYDTWNYTYAPPIYEGNYNPQELQVHRMLKQTIVGFPDLGDDYKKFCILAKMQAHKALNIVSIFLHILEYLLELPTDAMNFCCALDGMFIFKLAIRKPEEGRGVRTRSYTEFPSKVVFPSTPRRIETHMALLYDVTRKRAEKIRTEKSITGEHVSNKPIGIRTRLNKVFFKSRGRCCDCWRRLYPIKLLRKGKEYFRETYERKSNNEEVGKNLKAPLRCYHCVRRRIDIVSRLEAKEMIFDSIFEEVIADTEEEEALSLVKNPNPILVTRSAFIGQNPAKCSELGHRNVKLRNGMEALSDVIWSVQSLERYTTTERLIEEILDTLHGHDVKVQSQWLSVQADKIFKKRRMAYLKSGRVQNQFFTALIDTYYCSDMTKDVGCSAYHEVLYLKEQVQWLIDKIHLYAAISMEDPRLRSPLNNSFLIRPFMNFLRFYKRNTDISSFQFIGDETTRKNRNYMFTDRDLVLRGLKFISGDEMKEEMKAMYGTVTKDSYLSGMAIKIDEIKKERKKRRRNLELDFQSPLETFYKVASKGTKRKLLDTSPSEPTTRKRFRSKLVLKEIDYMDSDDDSEDGSIFDEKGMKMDIDTDENGNWKVIVKKMEMKAEMKEKMKE